MEGRAYTATALSDCLRTGVAGSMRNMARIYGADWVWRAYAQLPWSVATGRAGFEAAHGQPLFAFLNEHADASGMFHEAMAAFSEQEVTAILGAYDFAYAECVVDVGGGNGALLAAIAMAHPGLSGILFDQVATTGSGTPRARNSGRGGSRFGLARRLLPERARKWGPLPSQERDPRLGRRRRNPNPEACRRAMADFARLLVIERVVPDGPEASEAKLFDINMLVMTGGCERTEAEHMALLAKAGFTFLRTITTPSPLSLIEAVPSK